MMMIRDHDDDNPEYDRHDDAVEACNLFTHIQILQCKDDRSKAMMPVKKFIIMMLSWLPPVVLVISSI